MKQRAYNFLRWSEKYMKTDMVYLAHGGFWLTFGQGINAIITLLLAIAFANLLDPEIYGNYKYVISLAGIIGAFSLTGLGTSITRAVAQGYEGVLRQAFLVNLKWSFGIVLISLIGAAYYFLHDNNVLAISLIIVAFFLPLIRSAQLFDTFLNGKKEFKKISLYRISSTFFIALSLIATLLVTKNSIFIVLEFFASELLSALFFYLLITKKSLLNTKISKDVFSYGKHLSLMEIIGTVANYADKILIFQLLGGTPLAVYAFAQAIPQQLNSVAKNIKVLILPKLSNKPVEEIRGAMFVRSLKLFIGLTLITFIYIALAPFIFKIFFPQYLEAVFYSQILSLGLVLNTTIPFSQTLVAHAKKKDLYILKTIVPIIKLFLLIILIPLLGIMGAIISVIGARTINFIMSVYFFYKNE